MQNQNQNQTPKAEPFIIFSPDGFEPKLTLAAITDHDAIRAGIIGKGNKKYIAELLAALIPVVLSAGLSADELAMACAIGLEQAKEKGIKVRFDLADDEDDYE